MLTKLDLRLGSDIVNVRRNRVAAVIAEEFVRISNCLLMLTEPKRRERSHVERLGGERVLRMLFGERSITLHGSGSLLRYFVERVRLVQEQVHCIGSVPRGLGNLPDDLNGL